MQLLFLTDHQKWLPPYSFRYGPRLVGPKSDAAKMAAELQAVSLVAIAIWKSSSWGFAAAVPEKGDVRLSNSSKWSYTC